MASRSTDPDRTQASGWYAEGAGQGQTLHVREEMLLHGLAEPPIALVVKLFSDFWITTIEDWRGTDR